MLKFETDHRMSTLAEFLVDGIPNLGKCWSEHSYAFTGRALLPDPWMWQESQAIHEVGGDVGDALFFSSGGEVQKKGDARLGFGEGVRTYPLVDAAAVASWNKTLRKIEKGKWVQWNDFVAFMSIHRVNAERCTCPTYRTYAMCGGVLLSHIVKVPGFKVPTQYSWELIAQRPFKLGRVERLVTVFLKESPQEGPETKRSAIQYGWCSVRCGRGCCGSALQRRLRPA